MLNGRTQRLALLAMTLFAVIITLFAGPALAQVRATNRLIIKHDYGGSIGQRQHELRSLRRERKRVEIHGTCNSACTMYLGLPTVCVSPSASFGFHGPKGVNGPLPPDAFEHWSRVMSQGLPPSLERWFMQQARYVRSGFLRISGKQLINMGYARC
ncbi:hypothetical protein GGR95_003358 [Sulfitobacter undariae]|uniref:Uncharacterized protein n=1 Tax=Sulfitobacter undariae TaxID=1563671 RepID=A0A7W6E7K9_9RHOB|nr:hypothetical protein [Sulfitobacter undariae]